MCVFACVRARMPPYLGACWWFCQTLASRHRPADKTHTQKRGMRHSKPLPSMRLYCEALEKQRGAADGGPSGEGYREREREGRREREYDGGERKGLK